LKRYGGTVEHVLAAYNAGPVNVDRWKRRLPEANTLLFSDLIPFKETRTYVAIILRNAYWYGRLLVQLDDDVAKKVRDLSSKAVWRSQMVHSLLSAAWGQSEKDQVVVQLNDLYNAKKEPVVEPVNSLP
jgi:soluble lytic murein transglycosylase